MLISQTAKAAGVNTQTLRYYERRGLLPQPNRRGSGYRVYTSDAVRVVRFIKRAQDLGFSLDEIEQLVGLRTARRAGRTRARSIATRKIEDIDRKISQLRAMRGALEKLVASCEHGDEKTECPIIEALDGD